MTFQETTATTSTPNAPARPAPTGSSTPDDRSTTFQPVEGGPEQHSGSTLLVEAYAVLWIILMTWVLLMWRRQASLGARLEGLERALDRAAAKAQPKKG